MDEDDEEFAALVAAMSAEVCSDGAEAISPPGMQIPSSSHGTGGSQEGQSVSEMMQRIRQLESELAREKGINSQAPPPSATAPLAAAQKSSFSAQKSSFSAQKSVKKATLTDLEFSVFTLKPKSAAVSEQASCFDGEMNVAVFANQLTPSSALSSAVPS